MNIIIISHWRFPSEKTMAPYIMRVAEALTRQSGVTLELWAPKRYNPDLVHTDPFLYHGIEKRFSIRYLPVLDLIGTIPGGFHLMLLSFAVSVFFAVLRLRGRRDVVFYFFDLRDALPVILLSGKTFSEIHMYYRSSVDFINRFAFSKMAGFIVATGSMLTDILRDYAVPPSKTIHEPCAVNFERFGITTSTEEARSVLGLPLSEKIILYTGHLFPVKGVDVLFDAHTDLSEGEVIYFVGGTDEDIERFNRKWKDAGSPSTIRIIGRRPHQEIPTWLRAADMLSIPNTAKDPAGSIESSPSKLIEYMASGRPIIASDVPAIKDVLKESMAYFCEPDNSLAIADAIHCVLAHEDDATERAARARVAAQRLSWESRAERIVSFIQTRIA